MPDVTGDEMRGFSGDRAFEKTVVVGIRTDCEPFRGLYNKCKGAERAHQFSPPILVEIEFGPIKDALVYRAKRQARHKARATQPRRGSPLETARCPVQDG